MPRCKKVCVMGKFVKATADKDEKKCPLFYLQTGMIVCDCIKVDCMFWNDKAQDCNINVLARKL